MYTVCTFSTLVCTVYVPKHVHCMYTVCTVYVQCLYRDSSFSGWFISGMYRVRTVYRNLSSRNRAFPARLKAAQRQNQNQSKYSFKPSLCHPFPLQGQGQLQGGSGWPGAGGCGAAAAGAAVGGVGHTRRAGGHHLALAT